MTLSSFSNVIEKHPHIWHDGELVREMAEKAMHSTSTDSSFTIRVRNANGETEFLTLHFDVANGYIVLRNIK